MKIGIYGGSFNPIHKGHIKVAEYAIDKLGLDKLYFVLSYKSPFKSKVKYVDAKHRINMINLVKPKKSIISMFEINRKGISFTIDTIRHFKLKFPNDELFFLIGSDNVYKLNKWKDIYEIVDKAKLVVFKRKGQFAKINIQKYNAILFDNPLFDYASSWFRKGYMHNVNEHVMKYISSNYLYITDLAMHMLDFQRYKHSISTGSYAAKIAKSIGIDPKKAWAAGCLHDITKSWSKTTHRKYLTKKNIDETQIQDHELHSLTGMIWVRDEYKLDDKEILNAILRHTTLDFKLSKFDKIIFAADKLCDGRVHKGIQKDRKLILEDFDAGFKNIISIVYKILLDMERPLVERQHQIYKELM